MMIRKLLKVITLATGLLAAGASFGANGDIFEIRPCDQLGNPKTYAAGIDKPMTSGESLYFKVRLVQRAFRDSGSSWYLKYTGLSSELIDGQYFPLQLGIYVSGQLKLADLYNYVVDETGMFTDLIFTYKTVPGDVALPIVLATQSGPASDKLVENSAYFLVNTDKWAIVNDNGNVCNFWFWSQSSTPNPQQWGGIQSPDGGTAVQDYDLSKCGFYVQTVNFDPEWEE